MEIEILVQMGKITHIGCICTSYIGSAWNPVPSVSKVLSFLDPCIVSHAK